MNQNQENHIGFSLTGYLLEGKGGTLSNYSVTTSVTLDYSTKIRTSGSL